MDALTNFTWTEEREADLRRRYDAGESTGYIASAYGVSRSAVVGKLHRLGLKRGHPVAKPKERKVRAVSFELPSKRGSRPKVSLPPIERSPVPVVACQPKPLHELPFTGACKFEVSGSDKPAEYLFCSNPTEKDVPYCGQHCEILYRGPHWTSWGNKAGKFGAEVA